MSKASQYTNELSVDGAGLLASICVGCSLKLKKKCIEKAKQIRKKDVKN
jgi:hypothetical protein